MELGWLKDFEALVAHRNFSRAAEERHSSQPALSRRIRALEQEVGAQLINRETLPLSLTPAGDLFLAQARTILATWADTIERCQTLEAAHDAVVRFATTHSLYTSFYHQSIAPIAEDHGLSTDLNSIAWSVEQFVSALSQGYCDAILIYWHPAIDVLATLDQPRFDHMTLATDRLELLSQATPQGPLFDPVTARAPLPLLGYSAASALRPVQDALVPTQLGRPGHFIVNQNAQSMSIKAMILAGFGLGWLPSSLCTHEIATGQLTPLNGNSAPPLEIRLYIDRTNPKPALKKFWETIRLRTPEPKGGGAAPS